MLLPCPWRRRTHRPDWLRKTPGELCEGWPPVFLLPVNQLLQTLPELVKRFALVSEQQKPEPFSVAGLLHKQFPGVGRGHVHLPFLVAVGRRFAGRWPCGLRLPRMITAKFCAVNTPKTVPKFPFRGNCGNYFCTNFCGGFSCKMHSLGDYRGHIYPGYQDTRPGA